MISTSKKIIVYDYEHFENNDYFGNVITDDELEEILDIINRNK